MLVFSLTHLPSGRIFVTSSRLPMEERWQEIIEMAESGSQGPFLDLLRAEGEDRFRLDEWGESDNASELRRLLDEAIRELDGEPLRLTPPARQPARNASFDHDAFKKLLQDIESGDPEFDRDDEPMSTAERAHQNQARCTTDRMQPTVKPSKAGSVTSTPVVPKESTSARKRRINDALRLQREEREQLRQTASTEQADEMRELILAIETRRQKQKKQPSKARARRRPAAVKQGRERTSGRSQPPAMEAPARLAEGRARSSSKERRIREQLKLERERREQEQLARIAKEKDEMAEILARIDARASKIPNRRR